jgi:tRNA (cmo5U34)-methyltransferase
MSQEEDAIAFDAERAASYDERRDKLAALKDALHLCTRMVFAELPADAHFLCVGVGTGAELFALAEAFPSWRFTALDPAKPMLDICKRRAEEAGILDRCHFHEGVVDSLPEGETFHGATCILASHFLVNADERRALFTGIADRLFHGGMVVNADLSSDVESDVFQELFRIWGHMLTFSGFPKEHQEKFNASIGKAVAVLPSHEVEEIIGSAGFEKPVLFFQTVLIHAWFAKKA